VVCRKIVKVARTSDHVVAFRKNEGAPGIKAFIALLRARARSAQRAIPKNPVPELIRA
jgi:hypothetical protein